MHISSQRKSSQANLASSSSNCWIWNSFSSPVSVLHVQIQVPKLLLSNRTTEAQLPLSPAAVTEIELLLCLELLQEKLLHRDCFRFLSCFTQSHCAISHPAAPLSPLHGSVEPGTELQDEQHIGVIYTPRVITHLI